MAKPTGRVMFRGREMSKAEMVETMVDRGFVLQEDMEPSVKYDRRRFNQMGWSEQAEYEKKLKKLVVVYHAYDDDGGSFFKLTKTEAQYFVDLGGKVRAGRTYSNKL